MIGITKGSCQAGADGTVFSGGLPHSPAANPPDSPDGRRLAEQWLTRGRTLEAEGTPDALAAALQAYDAAIDQFRRELAAGHGVQHELAVAWMNRGSALQKRGTADALAGVVAAYDEAIALVSTLPCATNSVFRNCLGTAWLNRGNALLRLGDEHYAAGLESHEQALACLRDLPVDRIPVYRLNLAGAEVNQAHALLLRPAPAQLERARHAARNALALVAGQESAAIEFADLGLKARRAACDVLGRLLVTAGLGAAEIHQLATEASDMVDTGLALARHWERRGAVQFRRLARRFYYFGAQLYERYQPHFLAEFLLENIDPVSAPAAWSADGEMREIARTAVTRARRALAGRSLVNVDDAIRTKLLEASRSLAQAEARILALSVVA